MRKTSSDLAAVAARSDEGMWASPTRPRVEPRWAHGIGMPISHPSPLFYVVAVAALAAVATLASVATLAAVAAALGCSCGFTLGIPVTVAGSQWEKKNVRNAEAAAEAAAEAVAEAAAAAAAAAAVDAIRIEP